MKSACLGKREGYGAFNHLCVDSDQYGPAHCLYILHVTVFLINNNLASFFKPLKPIPKVCFHTTLVLLTRLDGGSIVDQLLQTICER